MEVEAIKQEYTTLESQLASLKKQITDLTMGVDSQKAKVTAIYH